MLASHSDEHMFAVLALGASSQLERSAECADEAVVLILTRYKNDEIQIGEHIAIKIEHVGPDRVRLAVDAPRDLLVLRTEMLGRDGVDTSPPGP